MKIDPPVYVVNLYQVEKPADNFIKARWFP